MVRAELVTGNMAVVFFLEGDALTKKSIMCHSVELLRAE